MRGFHSLIHCHTGYCRLRLSLSVAWQYQFDLGFVSALKHMRPLSEVRGDYCQAMRTADVEGVIVAISYLFWGHIKTLGRETTTASFIRCSQISPY